MSQFI